MLARARIEAPAKEECDGKSGNCSDPEEPHRLGWNAPVIEREIGNLQESPGAKDLETRYANDFTAFEF